VLNLHKPRDRTHFEQFGSFHRSFYRAVEATSVTPWASRALDRALAAVMVATARHIDRGLTPDAAVKELKKTRTADARFDEAVRAAKRTASQGLFEFIQRLAGGAMVVFLDRNEIEPDALPDLREVRRQCTQRRKVNEERAAIVFDAAMREGIAHALLDALEARIELLHAGLADIDEALQLVAPRHGQKRFQFAGGEWLRDPIAGLLFRTAIS
jgi:hypothetical protein